MGSFNARSFPNAADVNLRLRPEVVIMDWLSQPAIPGKSDVDQKNSGSMYLSKIGASRFLVQSHPKKRTCFQIPPHLVIADETGICIFGNRCVDCLTEPLCT